LLNETELGAFVDEYMGWSVFRLETLDQYSVDSDAGNVARYLAGEPAPSMAVKGPWLERLKAERASGKRRQRVHVVRSPLSAYLRYECEWGYAYTSQAGEEIRILDLTEVSASPNLLDQDFLLLNDERAVLMCYDPAGRFLGAEPQGPEVLDRFQRCRDTAWEAALDFETYWERHPEYWRENRLGSGR
jgi:hypothetical protein